MLNKYNMQLIFVISIIIFFSIIFGLVLLDLFDKVTLVEQMVWVEVDKAESIVDQHEDLNQNLQKQSEEVIQKEKALIQKKDSEKSALRTLLESFFGGKNN